ncbi:MAG: hypothetical protein GY815_10825 [Gammaproteobacteria bacterium]|nr:hypothetical protein [Gammaproteobacteria bacterium]
MTQQNDELLNTLISRGCTTKAVDGITLISLPDDEAEFIFEPLGGWLYLGTTFMEPEEFEVSEHEGQLNRFLLELQHRNLGCRFSYDGAGFLTLGGELDPEHQQADDVLQMLVQILFIIESCIHMCDQVLDSGQSPSDREVDEAFGVNENLH